MVGVAEERSPGGTWSASPAGSARAGLPARPAAPASRRAAEVEEGPRHQRLLGVLRGEVEEEAVPGSAWRAPGGARPPSSPSGRRLGEEGPRRLSASATARTMSACCGRCPAYGKRRAAGDLARPSPRRSAARAAATCRRTRTSRSAGGPAGSKGTSVPGGHRPRWRPRPASAPPGTGATEGPPAAGAGRQQRA